MNILDRVVSAISPTAGVRRLAARQVLAQYEGAEPSRLRKFRREVNSVNDLVRKSAPALRAQARYLERNHDLSRGALRVLVNNTVGPSGIGIEPQPRRADGSIHTEFAKALTALYKSWARYPEVTKKHSWTRVQRLAAQAWFRDGEVFSQLLIGPVTGLYYKTKVPFALELLESDLVPSDYDSADGSIRQGIRRNAWGEPRGYFVSKVTPDQWTQASLSSNLKEIPAERMLHLYRSDRIHQIRGVSEFASVITRIEDIKDYEESERVAAKIAAMLTGYIKKGESGQYGEGGTPSSGSPRSLGLQAGTFVDDLNQGEDIVLVDTKRPNPNLITFRGGQLRAAAAGLGSSYSSLSRDYNGTYSAQRQELVEQWVNYAVLTDDFVSDFVQPAWENFVSAAIMSGAIAVPRDVQLGTENDAIFVAQQMPWIDPLKEATACETLVQAGFASEVEMIRKRGATPTEVLEQIAWWRKACADRGISFTTNPDAASRVIKNRLSTAP